MPKWAKRLFEPHRYKILHGGRGGAKSYAIADALLIQGAQEKHRVLCTREYQASIKDSVHRLLADRITDLGLDGFYEVQRDKIVGANGTEFVFYGVARHPDSIKSMQGITRLWVEEAHNVSEHSWRTLGPTIRKNESEVWISFNPYQREDPTSQRYIEGFDQLRATVEKMGHSAIRLEVNYRDNPFFLTHSNLEVERQLDLERLDPQTYEHIWNGAYLENSDSQVLHGKYRIAEFEPGENWNGPYHGLDFGFSQDPTAATKSWIHGGRLYIERESGGIGVELDHTTAMLTKDIPGIERFEVIADNARPESISYLKRHGMPRVKACRKWSGSVEDGIAYLRSFKEIVIHPRCKETAKEARLYSYKVDDKSGQVLDKIVDAHNHYIDSIRYAHDPMMKGPNPVFTKVRMA